MGFTCILETNILLVGRYWDFKALRTSKVAFPSILETGQTVLMDSVNQDQTALNFQSDLRSTMSVAL